MHFSKRKYKSGNIPTYYALINDKNVSYLNLLKPDLTIRLKDHHVMDTDFWAHSIRYTEEEINVIKQLHPKIKIISINDLAILKNQLYRQIFQSNLCEERKQSNDNQQEQSHDSLSA
jgi:isochorismate hydrolase